LISLVLQVTAGVAILLGLVIAVELGWLLHERKIDRAEVRSPNIIAKEREGFDETLRSIGSLGTPQAVIYGYREVKKSLVSAVGLEEKKDRTEREIVQEIKGIPSLKPMQYELERIYRTYERVRFGSHGVSKEEVELFLGDLREIYGTLVDKGYCKSVVG